MLWHTMIWTCLYFKAYVNFKYFVPLKVFFRYLGPVHFEDVDFKVYAHFRHVSILMPMPIFRTMTNFKAYCSLKDSEWNSLVYAKNLPTRSFRMVWVFGLNELFPLDFLESTQ